jgi:hypothetical protein
MMNGDLGGSDFYRRIPDHFIKTVLGCADWPEYELLNEVERHLSGVVAAAFTKFWMRFQIAEKNGLGGRDRRTLDSCYCAVEYLAVSDDPEAKVLIRDEIFDNIDADAEDEIWRTIEGRLGPCSRACFSEWRRLA